MLLILLNMGAGVTSPVSPAPPASSSPGPPVSSPAPPVSSPGPPVSSSFRPPTSPSSVSPVQVGAVILDVTFLGRIQGVIDVTYFERPVLDTLDFIRVPVDVSFLP